MLTTVVIFVVKIAREHLLPLSIISIEDRKGAIPQLPNRLDIICLRRLLDEPFPRIIFGACSLLLRCLLLRFLAGLLGRTLAI
jgi:hypothetical protein